MNFQTRYAAKILSVGGVISNPTDTVQGLTCLPYEKSMQKMLWLKHRSPAKGLILLASDLHFFYPYVEDTSLLAQIKLQKHPTTYLFNAHHNTSKLITGIFKTVAIRLTDNALISDLCQQCQSSLVSSSANISGYKTATSLLSLTLNFHQELDFILAPRHGNFQASHIINAHTQERVR
ncbi:Threonylcarbamoyl-AMP synthase (EC [Bathymodiolus thermophilus thioautotrophic gill symbiont]|jgi:L-threonylcarbamoyladenylate synthase|uniref:Threonylcarbamoyl-AMP synthase (EC) n=3 Tax=sulfur-oxidizing symbionts TaxID=32036 RepID=A0ACA8ZV19_9GAMM|nr:MULTISPECIES: Sua5/YciO/YrdC/YwlC family protein [sulfur-oxidizing symbionts]CAC9990951.1 Threonylcarbamoyl-AMP synthase (EC 2.7.7.87) [uncultured Gammaproteobacteria bacterium]CAB5507506.1 Threonylcarbamoyl-AMP synthase (EC [Bathymodiolus thermophilus thioautotrophic gill symbiont]CAB5507641.1 Threonylcarbamoyl-AMP synthase (EC [Bathymodiolus azoricus thioautotrophic gill symbiont]SEH65852.1 translation factor SUA5 [Bathymodiolus azoricus thioautotrophic gill symbiont]VVH54908.1 TsaC prote